MRYRLRTLLILAILGPPALAVMGCYSGNATADKEPNYEVFRKPFPNEIQRVLSEAERFVLFSIEGEGEILQERTESSFHGFTILGKTQIEDASGRKELLDSLNKGISEAMGPALCFAPRHGISATLGDMTVDVVICFECWQIHVVGNREKRLFSTSTSETPTNAFNAALIRAGVPLAKPPL